MAPTGDVRAGIDLRTISTGSWGTFLYGAPRVLVEKVAYAMATAQDPNPTWVDIQAPRGEAEGGGFRDLGWIPEDHLYLVAPGDAKPQDATANLALWTVVRSDEPKSAVAPLTDFLRLPSLIQAVVSQMETDPRRSTLVIANTDRVRAYYPREPAGVRPIIDAMLHAGVRPIFAAVGPPGEGRSAFDFVFEVEARDLEHWREGTLVCHKAPAGVEVAIGVPVALGAVLPALDGSKDSAARAHR